MSVAGLRAGVLGKPSAARAVLEGACGVEVTAIPSCSLAALEPPDYPDQSSF